MEKKEVENFVIRIPKNEYVQAFTLYVLNPEGDCYATKTTEKSMEFNAHELVIDIYNQSVIEKHQNELPTQIYLFERALGEVEVLLQALKREEQAYEAQRYGKIEDKNLKTEAAKSNFLMASSFEDPTGVLFNQYIAKSNYDAAVLRMCIKALTSHQFKCKQIYQTLYGNKKTSITLD